MSKFIKKSLQENDKLCHVSYNRVFYPIFYMLGIMKELSDTLLKHFTLNKHVRTYQFRQIIDERGVPIDILISYFRQIYQETVDDFDTTVKTCYYINHIVKLLTDLKKQTSTIYSTHLFSIIETVLHLTHHEILLRAPHWFSAFSTNLHEFWPNLIPIQCNSFNIVTNSKGRITSGMLTKFTSFSKPNIEMWVIPINERTDHIRLTHENGSNNVHIGWEKTDSHEWFCDLICDNTFYNKGGQLCRMLFYEQGRVKNKQVIIHSKTKDTVNVRVFAKILKKLSKGTDDFRTMITPWGKICFDIADLVDYEDLPPFFLGKITNKNIKI